MATDRNFTNGDLVYHKSNPGQYMVVTEVVGITITCSWFTNISPPFNGVTNQRSTSDFYDYELNKSTKVPNG